MNWTLESKMIDHVIHRMRAEPITDHQGNLFPAPTPEEMKTAQEILDYAKESTIRNLIIAVQGIGVTLPNGENYFLREVPWYEIYMNLAEHLEHCPAARQKDTDYVKENMLACLAEIRSKTIVWRKGNETTVLKELHKIAASALEFARIEDEQKSDRKLKDKTGEGQNES